MKAKLAISAGLALWACSAVPSHAGERLNVLCGVDVDWCAAMEAAFERSSGLDIVMTRKSTGEILDEIRAGRDAPSVDVWWGGTGDTHLQAAAEGLLEPYTSPAEAGLLPWARNFHDMSDGQASGVYAGALGFAYNSEVLEAKNLPAPTCWNDLTSPAYRGLVQIANPETSGTAYTALATLIQLFGEDEAFTYFRDLSANVAKFTTSGSAPVKAAARGETMIGISFIHDAVTQKSSGAPLVIVAPCEGTGYEIGAVSIVRGTKLKALAQSFVDFTLSAEGQATGAASGQNQVPSNAKALLPTAAPDISLIRMVDYDFATFGSPDQRRRILDRFEKEVALTN
ncbi:ABC transporter substrate-binding protein [Roseibium litorale]|uniref:ABC transporter substrate-binding protein n=1 Tax=Roseibium litorale TaxID=2803841 RepID=UPI0031B591AB